MQWNNLKQPQTKIYSEDGTLVATATTPAIANYIVQMHNNKLAERRQQNPKRFVKL